MALTPTPHEPNPSPLSPTPDFDSLLVYESMEEITKDYSTRRTG